jgi:predicted Abi (CAAX) family protease
MNHELFKEVAPWLGRLKKFEKNKRHEKGGVLCEVLSAPTPYKGLIGLTVFLVWEDHESHEGLQEALRMDISFGEEMKKAKLKGNLLPDDVDGLKNVSSLEILASLAKHDEFTVIIESPKVEKTKYGIELVTCFEPIQALGEKKAFIQFVKPIDEKKEIWQVAHYNKEKNDFSGVLTAMQFIAPYDLKGCPIPLTTLENIHLSPLNQKGWFVFGVQEEISFRIHGLEPFVLGEIEEEFFIEGVEPSKEYLEKGVWDPLKQQKGTISKTYLMPKPSLLTFKEGDQFPLLHLIGGFSGPHELKVLQFFKKFQVHKFAEMTCFLRAGHFSFGRALVVKEEFTGRLKWEITYHQVFFVNAVPRFSGTQSWHKYMGSANLGAMFLRPSLDLLILEEEFNRKNFEGHSSPIEIFRHYLEKITALSRRGVKGSGGLSFDPINTCTKESGQALFHLCHDVENVTSDDYNRLKNLFKRVKTSLLKNPEKAPLLRWQKTEEGKIDSKISSLKKWRYYNETNKTALPINFQKRMGFACLEEGVPLFALKTNMIGGFSHEFSPRVPNHSLKAILKTLWNDFMQKN